MECGCLTAIVQELVGKTLYRVRVRQVTSEFDVELVGRDLLLSVLPETVILWIGNNNLDVGTILLIPVSSAGAVPSSSRRYRKRASNGRGRAGAGR
jgi:hypothetical protein